MSQWGDLKGAVAETVRSADLNVLDVHDVQITGRFGSRHISLHVRIWQDAKPPEYKTILRNIAEALRSRFGAETKITIQHELDYTCPTKKTCLPVGGGHQKTPRA